MLMYEFRDIFNVMNRRCSCNNCFYQKDCYERKRTYGEGNCASCVATYKHPEINMANASWILKQIGQDVQNTKLIIETKKDSMRYDSILSPSLRPSIKEESTLQELNLYLLTLSTYLNFICDFEKGLSKLKAPDIAIKIFVGSTINTAIKVDGEEVQVFTENIELNEILRNVVLKSSYQYRTIKTKEESDAWWKRV